MKHHVIVTRETAHESTAGFDMQFIAAHEVGSYRDGVDLARSLCAADATITTYRICIPVAEWLATHGFSK